VPADASYFFQLPIVLLEIFALLRSVYWQLCTYFSGQHIGPIFKGQVVQEECLRSSSSCLRIFPRLPVTSTFLLSIPQ